MLKTSYHNILQLIDQSSFIQKHKNTNYSKKQKLLMSQPHQLISTIPINKLNQQNLFSNSTSHFGNGHKINTKQPHYYDTNSRLFPTQPGVYHKTQPSQDDYKGNEFRVTPTQLEGKTKTSDQLLRNIKELGLIKQQNQFHQQPQKSSAQLVVQNPKPKKQYEPQTLNETKERMATIMNELKQNKKSDKLDDKSIANQVYVSKLQDVKSQLDKQTAGIETGRESTQSTKKQLDFSKEKLLTLASGLRPTSPSSVFDNKETELTKRVTELNFENQSQKQTIQNLQDKIRKLEMEKMQTINEQNQAKSQEMQKELEFLKTQNKDLKNQAQKTLKLLEESRQASLQSKNELGYKDQEIQQLKTTLQTDQIKFRKELEELLEEKNSLKKQLQQTKQQKDQTAEVNSVKNELQSIKEELLELRLQLQFKQNEILQLNQKNQQLQQQIEKLETAQGSQEIVEQESKYIKELELKLEQLKNVINQDQKKLEDANSINLQQQQQVQKLSSEVNQLHDTQKQMVQDKQDLKDQLIKQMEDQEQSNNEYQQQIKSLEEKVDSLQNQQKQNTPQVSLPSPSKAQDRIALIRDVFNPENELYQKKNKFYISELNHWRQRYSVLEKIHKEVQKQLRNLSEEWNKYQQNQIQQSSVQFNTPVKQTEQVVTNQAIQQQHGYKVSKKIQQIHEMLLEAGVYGGTPVKKSDTTAEKDQSHIMKDVVLEKLNAKKEPQLNDSIEASRC